MSDIQKLLHTLLNISEDMMNSLDNPETLEKLLSEREKIIDQLQEHKYFKTGTQKKNIDQLIKLILAVDRYIDASIRDKQNKLIQSIGNNILERKVASYGKTLASQKGKLLNYKR